MKFILGRSGTGKSTLCMNQIKETIDSGFDKPVIYIVPEQFSFESEKKLIEVLGRSGIIGAQVLSFKRLAYKIFNENNVVLNTLNDSSRAMLVYYIMLSKESELQVLKGASKNPGMVNSVLDEISEFKRYGLSPKSFEGFDFKNEYLNRKIHDICLIFEEYEKRISDTYVDSNDDLTILCELIKGKDNYLNGAKIWIDEFDGFITQEVNIIKALDKKCNVTISMISDDDELFEINNMNLKKFDIDLVSNSCRCEQNYRFNNDDLKHLEKSIYKYPINKYETQVDHIFVDEYQNAHEEIHSVSKEILNIVRNNDVRFENIAILTRDIDSYKNLFKMIFPMYEIPFFFDDKKELSQEPIITLILSFIDIISNGYKYENVFSYLKTGLTNIQNLDDIDLIENYVLKFGIKGNKWEEEFVLEDKNLERINLIREEIVKPIMRFKENFSGRKTANEIVTSLYDFLNEINLYNIINESIEKLENAGDIVLLRQAQEYAQVWNILISLLDDINTTLENEYITFDKFKSIFKIGISYNSISVIPSTKDKVIIGDIERTRNSDIKYLFIIGVNEGEFPKTFQNEGFINDKERAILLENGIEIAKDTKMLLKQEYFNIYKSLSVPSDYLYISYPISDLEGKTKRPAFLINQIKEMFPSIHSSMTNKDTILARKASFAESLNMLYKKENGEETSKYWDNVLGWYGTNEKDRFEAVIKGLDFKNTTEFQSKEVSKLLYGTKINSSVSKLEQFVSCPFSFYLRYGLYLREREVYKIDTPDTGSFLHEIIEKFSKKVIEEEIDLRDLDKSKCDEIVSQISEDVLINFRHNLFSSTGRLRTLSIKLIELVKKTIWLIVCHLNAGEFGLYGSEVEFGPGKEYGEINVELSNGEELVLSGKVDRIDVAKLDDGNYLRIVDYKSSNKKIKLSNVYYGIQLQLLTYVNAISNEELNPAGALYLHLSDPIVSSDRRISKEEVEQAIINSLRMNGIVISNVKLIEAMGGQEVLNLKQTKEGKYTGMPVVSKEDFDRLTNHINTTLKKIGDEIVSGNVKNEPIYRKSARIPCEYCDYKMTCQFDRKLGNKYRVVKNLKDDEVLDLLGD
ncbi:MAG: helicase-exonuclease AddAB subunit AddB [Clostridia bacterium]|nr:helicase-exonuclease AddAB subunit AddB [Clostridia bacterium]